MKGLMLRYGKKLSTFEFERQNIAGCCKQTFHFQFNIKLIQSKTWFFQFSQWPTEWVQKFKFLQNSCRVKWFHETELLGLHLYCQKYIIGSKNKSCNKPRISFEIVHKLGYVMLYIKGDPWLIDSTKIGENGEKTLKMRHIEQPKSNENEK